MLAVLHGEGLEDTVHDLARQIRRKVGNLVGVDNDGDYPGEVERVVYVTYGSDSGWRTTWQYGKYTDPKNNTYNVWMNEGMFRPRFDGQAAYITPPVGLNLFVTSGVSQLPVTKVIHAALPWLVVLLAALIVVTYVPWVSLVLPRALN